jgi:sugar phosphate isomerase/epimerase
VRVASPVDDDIVIGAFAASLTLAARLGAPIVRVFPGAPTRPSRPDRRPELTESEEAVAEQAARRLNAVAGISDELGVYAALETHDSRPHGADVARILSMVDGPVGVVWVLMHPWRMGESLQHTLDTLSPWLFNNGSCVQAKDAHFPLSDTPLALREGTLPLDDFAEPLIDCGYASPICLE